MKLLPILLLVLMVASCTDGQRGKLMSYGSSRSIECYSGSKMIYKGKSTGKIQSEQNSDGYYFTEEGTNKLMEVSGNCIIGQ